jgi:hypothetical protein
VDAHVLSLLLIQRGGLEQHFVFDGALADIVEPTSEEDQVSLVG